jgi:DNA-binding MarR family transcriptional regulator
VAESREILEKGEIFSAPHRLTIMLVLYLHRKAGFTELQRLLKLTPGNLDHHIRKLQEAGYVKTRKALAWRPLTVIEITREGAQAFRDYAVKLRKLLETVK